jgi:hypothetical protein
VKSRSESLHLGSLIPVFNSIETLNLLFYNLYKEKENDKKKVYLQVVPEMILVTVEV